MSTHDFIFSNQLRHKILRHVILWVTFSLHFVIQNLMIGGPGEGKTSRSFAESFFHFLYFLPIYLASVYFFLFVLLPRFFFQHRYIYFFISFTILFAINFIAIYFAGALYLHHQKDIPVSAVSFQANKYHAVVDGLFVPFMMFGITAGIRFSKKWYLQQRENEKLAKQKLATELRILKTSIHPRFLFHALHTVQKNISNASDQSPTLILQLSDLLSYILYENNENWAPLEKELEIINAYISLEEKNFDEPVVFNTELPRHVPDKFIIPSLLLAFVETCFEYFLVSKQDRPLFNLVITISENVLNYQLLFSIGAGDGLGVLTANDGFMNIRKQLDNHYPGLHQLKTDLQTGRIAVHLILPLYSGDLLKIKKTVISDEISAAV